MQVVLAGFNWQIKLLKPYWIRQKIHSSHFTIEEDIYIEVSKG